MITNSIKSLSRPLKRLVKRLLGHESLCGRLDDLASGMHHLTSRQQRLEMRQTFAISDLQIPPWYEQNLCEPTVQLALRDLCRPGDTVFDVGANAGALSVLMSRLVGRRGAVCSFEASRRIVDKTHHNLVVNGCNNVQLFHRAISHTSGQIATLYYGSDLNDSLLAQNDAGVGTCEVETLALDDFVAYTGLEPKLIKMDIEGAEYDALRGAERLIARSRPTFLLEQQTDDVRCVEFLKAAGYVIIDLASYRVINCSADYPAGVGIANVLCIHQSQIAATPYAPPFHQERVAEFDSAVFRKVAAGSLEMQFSLEQAGRYLFDFDFSAQGTRNNLVLGVERGGVALVRYQAYSKLLAAHYRQIPCDLKRPAALTIFVRFLDGTSDPTLRFKKVTVRRVVNFDSVPRPLVD